MSERLRFSAMSAAFDARLAPILAVLNIASDPAQRNTCSVTINRRGITMRLAGQIVVRNCPLEDFERRRQAEFDRIARMASETE